jgi:hypothetical protein
MVIQMYIGIMGDAWFGSVKAAMAFPKKDIMLFYNSNTGSSLFPKKFAEAVLKDSLGGLWITLQPTSQNVPLVAINFCFSACKTLFFVPKRCRNTCKR